MRSTPNSPLERRSQVLLLFVFAISGASGLVYELIWTRLLAHLLGGTTVAIGIVLASFMGGLALGSIFFGKRADSSPAPLRLYAWLEVGIAATAALVSFCIAAATPVYVAVAHRLPPAALVPLRLLFALVLLLPPTILMGGTLPALSRYLVRRRDRIGTGIGSLYGTNTVGAVAGAFLTGYVWIPALGIASCAGLAIAGNTIAAGIAFLLARRLPEPSPARPERGAAVRATKEPRASNVDAEPALGRRFLALALGLSGFAALGFELYWTRALHHFLGNNTYAFSAMLTTFLCGLALGGWVGGRLADRVTSPVRLLGWIVIGIAGTAALTVPLLWNALPRLEGTRFFSAPELTWSVYVLRRFVAAFAVMFVPALLSGMTLPLANRIGISSLTRVGDGVGALYAANTTGAIAGSLAAGFLFLPMLGVRAALLGTSLLCGVLGAAVHALHRPRRRAEPILAGVVVVGLALLAPVLHRNARTIWSDTQSSQDVVLFQRQDPTAETRVYRKPNGELHMSVDGHHIGGTEPDILRKEKVLAHLPMALAPRAEKVLAVGLGSGITLGTLALYAQVRELTCVEIVSGVIAGAPQFRDGNHDVLHDPRLRMVLGDGIQYLLTRSEPFDVISSDSKLNPEFVGNSSMLAREYYALCRDRLTERGIMVQWMPVHVPSSMNQLVTRGFCEAFPYVELFWIDPGHILMAGSRSSISFDLDRWRERSAAPGVRADLASLRLDDPYLIATSRVVGRDRLMAALGNGPVETWLRPRFEFRVLREYRLKAHDYHEADNLRWLAGLWSPDDFAVRGPVDRERLARFRDSTHEYLLGFASGGGTTRLAAGRKQFEAGLARNQDDLRIALALGQLRRAEGSAAATFDPRDASQWLERGLRHFDAHRADSALVYFDRAAELDPASSQARYDRLLALRQLGRPVGAEIERFTNDFPQDARGWSLLGRSRAEANDLEGSLAALQRAVALDPSTASFRNNLAVTFVRLQRFPEAAAAFAEAYRLDPLLPDAAYFAATSYSRAGRSREAVEWVRLCLQRKLADPARFLADPNFATLRTTDDWKQLAPDLSRTPR